MTAALAVHKAPFAVEWREGFRIGIDQLDREHRHLFTLVLALDLGTVEQTVEQLLDYVVTHFSNEQEAMESSGYPALEQHLRLHEQFASRIADFLMPANGWTEERVQDLRRFLNKWLISHIMTHDMRFGKWFAAHNLPASDADASAGRAGLIGRLFG
ncbi:MAG: hemerythrin family protein [Rhodoferax sp.]|nr:hemerythrin family protein [Rhodoferax sp.]